MVAWNPEFLREGFAVQDTLTPDRLVFGLEGDYSDIAEELLHRVYETPLDAGTPLVIADWPTAELVKVSANAFLATKISFINAISEICEASGADVTKIADAIGLDDRIGRKFLAAGLGFGGGCLPKDIRAFQARATELGVGSSLTFLAEIDAINIRRRERAVDLARDAVGGDLNGARITVLGATFKPNSDDVRDAPSLDVAARLHAAGAIVTVHDPEGLDNAARVHPQLGYQGDVNVAVTGADVLIVGTEWQHYRDLNPAVIADLMSGSTIIDARNALNANLWRVAGFTYTGFGRPNA
jgi:UDPglucose 6-dehydrogenase